MLTAFVYFIIGIVVLAILLEFLFWILAMIFPAPFAITSRIRGLAYALVFLIVLVWVLNHFAYVHLG